MAFGGPFLEYEEMQAKIDVDGVSFDLTITVNRLSPIALATGSGSSSGDSSSDVSMFRSPETGDGSPEHGAGDASSDAGTSQPNGARLMSNFHDNMMTSSPGPVNESPYVRDARSEAGVGRLNAWRRRREQARARPRPTMEDIVFEPIRPGMASAVRARFFGASIDLEAGHHH